MRYTSKSRGSADVMEQKVAWFFAPGNKIIFLAFLAFGPPVNGWTTSDDLRDNFLDDPGAPIRDFDLNPPRVAWRPRVTGTAAIRPPGSGPPPSSLATLATQCPARRPAPAVAVRAARNPETGPPPAIHPLYQGPLVPLTWPAVPPQTLW